MQRKPCVATTLEFWAATANETDITSRTSVWSGLVWSFGRSPEEEGSERSSHQPAMQPQTELYTSTTITLLKGRASDQRPLRLRHDPSQNIPIVHEPPPPYLPPLPPPSPHLPSAAETGFLLQGPKPIPPRLTERLFSCRAAMADPEEADRLFVCFIA